jgi:hypothetical protein
MSRKKSLIVSNGNKRACQKTLKKSNDLSFKRLILKNSKNFTVTWTITELMPHSSESVKLAEQTLRIFATYRIA